MRKKIKFLPLLLLYITFVLLFAQDEYYGDEERYVIFATNLSNGYYTSPDNLTLWNGPGYPIILLPFVLLKLPWLTAKLMNPLFLFLAVLIFYRMLQMYMKEKFAAFFAYLLGMYPPFMRYNHYLLTEVFTTLLICCFLFYFCKMNQDEKNKWGLLIVTSVFLGYLALTKIFFGYVLLAGLILFSILFLLKRRIIFKKAAIVYFLALIVCSPYLFYTYLLTGRLFYWGDSGGSTLYWMSTPYKNEMGDWRSVKQVFEDPQISKNHLEFFNKLENLSPVEKDDELKRHAILNIIHYPMKYLKNWVANIGRLLFNYPYSYTYQQLSTYFYILPNMFLVVFCVLCLYPSYKGKRLIPNEIHVLAIFGLISFGGSSLLSAYARLFQYLLPILLLWISVTLTKVVEIEIKR